MKKNIDVLAVMKRYGDGQHSSIREISREFGVAESTLRGVMETSARQGCPFARDFRQHRVEMLIARTEQTLHELGELRRELAERE